MIEFPAETDNILHTLVRLPEVVYPQVEAVVQAQPGVLPDDDAAGADDPVRLLPDHRRLACKGKRRREESESRIL